MNPRRIFATLRAPFPVTSSFPFGDLMLLLVLEKKKKKRKSAAVLLAMEARFMTQTSFLLLLSGDSQSGGGGGNYGWPHAIDSARVVGKRLLVQLASRHLPISCSPVFHFLPGWPK